MNYRFGKILLLVAFALLIQHTAKAEEIKVYTYHNHPPFINESGDGLTFDLETRLNSTASGTYSFHVTILPRKRLNMILKKWVQGKCLSASSKCDDGWMLLWVNQKWGFGNDPYTNFNWVELLNDSNAIVSLKQNEIEYAGPESLSGLKFGGMFGHKYVGIDDLVAQNKITRINGTKERDNIFKLYKQRVDVILLPSSTMKYFMQHDDEVKKFNGQLYISGQKHQSYLRNIMLPKTRTDLVQFIKSVDLSAIKAAGTV